MISRLLHLLFIALGMVHITIGPNNALQVLAWSKMFVDYSEGRSFSEAAEMTFDGDHPCSMCLALEETRKEEKTDPAPRPERTAERSELFPPQEIRPKHRRTFLSANSPPSPGHLLGHCRFFPELPTPPPQFS